MARFNTTSTPLAASASKTLDPIQTGNDDKITGLVYSDQSGSLEVQQSLDGTHWDYKDTIAVTGGTGAKIAVDVVAPFIRLKYTNGGTDQTEFRLSARLSSGGYRG